MQALNNIRHKLGKLWLRKTSALEVEISAHKQRADELLTRIANMEQEMTNQLEGLLFTYGANDRDKEIIFLSNLYFLGRYWRRNRLEPTFEAKPEYDPSATPGLQFLQACFSINRQQDEDFKGSTAKAMAALLNQHPLRTQIVTHLSEQELSHLFSSLEKMFSNQQFVATTEGWSYFPEEDEPSAESAYEFAFNTTAQILMLLEASSMMGQKAPIRVRWFETILEHDIREKIVQHVFRKRMLQFSDQLCLHKLLV